MNKEKIIEECKNNLPKFKEVLINTEYELRGIMPSESLLLGSIATLTNIELIIESGRARGYSTQILSGIFPNKNIVSIDLDNKSEDVKFSEKILKDKDNVELVYGDSNTIIKEKITKDCIVFIDGPKGVAALELAIDIIEDKRVKAICIHDLHKNTFARNLCEIFFNNTFFSDDLDFVHEFKNVDREAWTKLKDEGEKPYIRKNNNIESYASTLAVIINSENSTDTQAYVNYIEDYKSRNTLTHILGEKLNKIPMIKKVVLLIYKIIKK